MTDEHHELDPEVLADPTEDAGRDEDSADEKKAPTPPAEPNKVLEGEIVPATTPSPGDGKLATVDPFRRYIAELKRYPPLTREEERELARVYRDTGDRDALFRLVTANLMMVVKIALSFRRAAKNLLDLIQEGNVGLLQAIDRFDPELGNRLPTYAAWWVRAYMVKFLLDNVRLVRVGTTNARRKLLRNLRQEKARLEEMGFEVGPKLLAAHFDVSEQDVKDIEVALASHDVSIDAPVGGDGEDGVPRAEVMPSQSEDIESDVARRQIQAKVQEALELFRLDLNERERMLLDERIVSEEPITLQAIGDRFGTTREAARQAETRLLKRLHAFLKEQLGELGQVKLGPD